MSYALGSHNNPKSEQHYNPIDLLPIQKWSKLRSKIWIALEQEQKNDMITNAILHELGEYNYKTIPADPIKTIPPEVLKDLNKASEQQRPFPDFVKMLKSVTPPCKKSQ